VPPRHVLQLSEDYNVTGLGTTVKAASPKKIRRSSVSHHNVRFTPDSDRLLRCREMTLMGHKRHFALRKTAVDSGFDLLTRDEARRIAANIANAASIVGRGKSASDG